MNKVFSILALLLLLIMSVTPSHAAESRFALVIGNGRYDTGRLKNPANDATDMAVALKRLGFSVVLKKDARQQEMEEAIRDFGQRLKRGGVGLFFYAGHGLQIGGRNYLIPIGARIDKETDAKYQAIDAEMVLDEMANAGNPMNIVILDACRDNPLGRSLRSAGRGLAIISDAPKGTFITYSTSPGKTAADGAGRNSPYTAALLQSIKEPGLPIEQVFKRVRQRLSRETGDRQIPWELSSLQGDFYFMPGHVTDVPSVAVSPVVDDGAEQRKSSEGRELSRQKAALEEARRKIEEEKQQLALAKRPPPPAVKEIDRDRSFIAYADGTVLDMRTNLMWAAKGNGKSVEWANAKSYCENYRGGGYTNWRMPTLTELEGLYEPDRTTPWKVTTFIDVPSDCWASETRGDQAAHFVFGHGGRAWLWQGMGGVGIGAIPVRSLEAKREVKQESRFIDNGNGTVTDTKTGLMWAAKDSGSGVNWQNARSYCENYRVGGHTDWRMPTKDELVGLYNGVHRYLKSGCGRDAHVTEFIRFECGTWVWASETRGSEAAYLSFGALGTPEWNPQSDGSLQALPVRSAH